MRIRRERGRGRVDRVGSVRFGCFEIGEEKMRGGEGK